MNNIILECKNINKYIGKKHILKDASFCIEKGDILGFIGPNGAGKTTTMKIISNLMSKDSGSVTINGYDLNKDYEKAISEVGIIIEGPDPYYYLTGRKNLEINANLYKNISKDKIDEVIKKVKLEKRIDDKVQTYSLGMVQRLGIAISILHSPKLLILDEPTNGLDPEGIKELRNLLKELTNDGMTIMISSHNLSEIENICNKVCIIKNGQIIETNTIDNIKNKIVENNIIFNVSSTENISKILDNANIINDKEFSINTDNENINEIIEKIISENIKIYRIKDNNITLEEVFLDKTGGNEID